MKDLRFVSRRELSDEMSRVRFDDHEAKRLMVGLVSERTFNDVIYRQPCDGPVYKAKVVFSIDEMIGLAEDVHKVREKIRGSIPEDQREKLRLDVEKRYCAFFRVLPVPDKDGNYALANPFKFDDSLERMMQWSELKDELKDVAIDQYDALYLLKPYLSQKSFAIYVNHKDQRFGLKQLMQFVKDEYQRKYRRDMPAYDINKIRRELVSRYCDMYHILLLDPHNIGGNSARQMSDRVRKVLQDPNKAQRISVAEQIKGGQLGLFK